MKEKLSKKIEWKYYNHALIPSIAPHEVPDLTPLKDGTIWKIGGGVPLLARWTTDFGFSGETNWWWVIKDDPFDISVLKSKRRYEINKGKKNFEVKIIDPLNYKNEIYMITVAAYSQWDKKYRPAIEEVQFKKKLKNWTGNIIVMGAFEREENKLCGYIWFTDKDDYADFNVMRVLPSSEKMGINAALVAGLCEYYNSRLELDNGFYICDGSRSIYHETAFQNYLEKYFGFRKAYCHLNLLYRKPIGIVVNILMPFRKILYKMDTIKIINMINGILRMEEIRRNQVYFAE